MHLVDTSDLILPVFENTLHARTNLALKLRGSLRLRSFPSVCKRVAGASHADEERLETVPIAIVDERRQGVTLCLQFGDAGANLLEC